MKKTSTNPNREVWPWERTSVAVISNSDRRILDIVSSLDSITSVTRGARDIQETDNKRPFTNLEIPVIDHFILSCDVGYEKPDPRIFEVARHMLPSASRDTYEYLHIGDDLGKDVFGAREAGWHALLLDREGVYGSAAAGQGINRTLDDHNGKLLSHPVGVIDDLGSFTSWDSFQMR